MHYHVLINSATATPTLSRHTIIAKQYLHDDKRCKMYSSGNLILHVLMSLFGIHESGKVLTVLLLDAWK